MHACLLVLALLALQSASGLSCPEGWHLLDDHCYQYVRLNGTWFEAVRKCKEIGGYLLKYDTYTDVSLVPSYFKEIGKSPVWIQQGFDSTELSCVELSNEGTKGNPMCCDKHNFICERGAY